MSAGELPRTYGVAADKPLTVAEAYEFEGSAPIVMGKRISQKQWLAFQILMKPTRRTGKPLPRREVARIVECPEPELHDWVHSQWWSELARMCWGQAQAKLITGLSDMVPELLEGIREIVNGERATDKSTSAVANILNTMAQIGSAPLINKRNLTVNTTVINNGEMNVDVGKLSREELLAFQQTGQLPMPQAPPKVIDQELEMLERLKANLVIPVEAEPLKPE